MGLELLFAGLIGLGIGAVALLFATPKSAIGMALLPAIGAITALVFWVLASLARGLFDWSWLSYDGVMIWLLVVLLPAAVTFTIATTLPRRRAADDEDLFERLSHRGAATP